jgi:hypothetical protein
MDDAEWVTAMICVEYINIYRRTNRATPLAGLKLLDAISISALLGDQLHNETCD